MMKKQMKRNRGITLIALVVTIVVLLILAGASISMLTGENGIITQAQNAKLETRAGNVREEVDLWKTENALRKTNNEEQISKETMLSNLKNKGILYEEEINRQEEIITIGKNIIPYGTEVIININKTPETELSNAVLLQVTSVEGLGENIQLESEEQYMELLLNKINSMTDSEREALYADVYSQMFQEEGEDIYIENFNDLLQVMYESGAITEPTEEAFYEEWIEGKFRGIDFFHEEITYMIVDYGYNLIGELDYDTGILRFYIIINPANEEKDYYLATQNGNYTFIVEDIITGEQYSKTVNVSNVGENDKYYVGNIEFDTIGLLDKNNNEPTMFNRAFIIYYDEIVEITDLIVTEEYSYIAGNDLRKKFGWDIEGTQQIFVFEKDGILYLGEAHVTWEG